MNAIFAFLTAIFVLFGVRRVAEREALRNQPGYFSAEYRARLASPQWRAFRMRVLASTFGRDVVFPFLRASQVDHIGYRHFGKERIWLDVVPLHPATHRLVTILRDAGLREPVDAVLHLACAAWFTAYAALAVVLVTWLSGHARGVADLVLAAIHHVVS